jgi:hypothetical protein
MNLEALAAAITFLFRSSPKASNEGAIPMESDYKLNSPNMIKAVRFHWKAGVGTSVFSNFSSVRSDEWYTVDLLETSSAASAGKQQRTRFAMDEQSPVTPRTPHGSRSKTPTSKTPSNRGDSGNNSTQAGNFSVPKGQNEASNTALDIFLKVGYWVTTSSPAYLPTVLNHLSSSGGVLFGLEEGRGGSDRNATQSDNDTDDEDVDDNISQNRSGGNNRRTAASHPRSTFDDYDLSGSDKCFLNKAWMAIDNTDEQQQQQHQLSSVVVEVEFHHNIFNVLDVSSSNLRPVSYVSANGSTKFLYRPSSKRTAVGWNDEFSCLQVARSLLSKTLKQFSTVRRHDSDYLSSEIANSLARKQINVLSNCLADLASEGGRVREVCGSIQTLMNSLPGIYSTSLVIRDSFDNTVLFEKTSTLSSETKTSFAEPPTPMPGTISGNRSKRPQTATSSSSVTKSFFPDGNEDTSTNSDAKSPRTPGTSHGGNSFNFSSADINRSTSPTRQHSAGGPKKLFIDTGADLTSAVDLRAETELSFECFEVNGRFTVAHKHRHELEEECTENLLIYDLDLPEAVQDVCKKLPVHLSSALFAAGVTSANYVGAVRSMLQIVSRALGRRVFEIMRDRKHKKMLAENQDQINLQRGRIVESEASRSDLVQELDKCSKDAARLRTLLVEEQEDCRKAVSRSKSMEKKLAQTVLELKEENSKQESMLRKALNTAKEEKRLAIEKADRCARELARAQEREKLAEKAKRDSVRELEELEKQFRRGGANQEEVVRRLRQELQQSKVDLSQALSREIEKSGEGDSKLRSVLGQLQKSVEEVAASR